MSPLLDRLRRPGTVLLDTARVAEGDEAGALLFEDPVAVLTAERAADVSALLDALDVHAAAGRWCAGWLAYEAGYALEPTVFEPPPPGLLGWFGVYEAPERIPARELEAALDGAGAYRLPQPPAFGIGRAAYRACIGRIKDAIREGEVYQINFTAPFRFSFEGDALGLYRDLRRKQPVPFAAVVRTGERTVLSLSPELFVRRRGADVETRPMKGTAPRGPAAEADRAAAEALRADPKSRAENLMIVDLLRNDLSRVAAPGSVRVPALFTVERYPTLLQMTSTVAGTLPDGVGTAEVLRALFPCGSVTGAPKLRAMQLIRGLEAEPRGVYCGAIGYVAPGGRAAFSVPIRTLELRGAAGRMGSGSGVVWDSDADAEFGECLLKARFLTDPAPPAWRLLETLRWDGAFFRLDLHLARLARAAAFFDIPAEPAEVERVLASAVAGLDPAVRHRVRLTVDRYGAPEASAAPVREADLVLRRVAVFPEPLDPADPFLRHKTTRRAFYDRALAWARARGADEALLTTPEGAVAEGTFTNVFVRRGGRLVTPPLGRGGLDGVLRQHLLATGEAEVADVASGDLASAEALYAGNALRGLQAVRLVGETAATAAG